MTIIEAIKSSVEGVGCTFLYHAHGELNNLIASEPAFAGDAPVVLCYLLDSGTVEQAGGVWRERVNVGLFFSKVSQIDFDAMQNEQLLDKCKRYAMRWLAHVTADNAYLRLVNVNSSNRAYDTQADLLTAYAINVTIEALQGVTMCDIDAKPVTLNIVYNGTYDVSKYDKVVVDVHENQQHKTLHLEDISDTGVYEVEPDSNHVLTGVTVDVSEISKKVTGDGEDDIPQTNPVLAGDNPTVMGVLDRVKTRRINGFNELADGAVWSGLQLGVYDEIEEITETIPYDYRPNTTVMNAFIFENSARRTSKPFFPKLKKATLSMEYLKVYNGNIYFIWSDTLEYLNFPYLKEVLTGDKGIVTNCNALKTVLFPTLKIFHAGYHTQLSHIGIIYGCPLVKELAFPELVQFDINVTGGFNNCLVLFMTGLYSIDAQNLSVFTITSTGKDDCAVVKMCPSLRYIRVGSITRLDKKMRLIDISKYHNEKVENIFKNLIHIEFGNDSNVDMQAFIDHWVPTNAMDATKTDLIEDPTRCKTNREQFFTNFIELILHRLKDRTGEDKYTLTLYTTVYEAIFNDDSGFVYNGQPIGDYVTAYVASINWAIASI